MMSLVQDGLYPYPEYFGYFFGSVEGSGDVSSIFIYSRWFFLINSQWLAVSFRGVFWIKSHTFYSSSHQIRSTYIVMLFLWDFDGFIIREHQPRCWGKDKEWGVIGVITSLFLFFRNSLEITSERSPNDLDGTMSELRQRGTLGAVHT